MPPEDPFPDTVRVHAEFKGTPSHGDHDRAALHREHAEGRGDCFPEAAGELNDEQHASTGQRRHAGLSIWSSGVLGGAFGVVLGAIIGNAAYQGRPTGLPGLDVLLAPVDTCLAFFGALVGEAIGSLLGAIGGSVLGARLASRSTRTSSAMSSISEHEGTSSSSTPRGTGYHKMNTH